MNESFWKNKSVFLTGHTGFKGSWLSLWLQSAGAQVTGYALAPETEPNLFTLANVADGMTSIIDDIRNEAALNAAIKQCQPDIVLHLAAQPLVRLSYDKPAETFDINIMGTVHLLDAVRAQTCVKAVVIVTSDKCYDNKEWVWGYRETEAMGGKDPYSSSKGCAELVAASYRDSFLRDQGIAMATARAGNVIGGGDWAKDRLVPDILSAVENDADLIIRNPLAYRPWQHVLEPLNGYLMLAEKLFEHGDEYASAWNFGPSIEDVRPVEWIVEKLSTYCQASLLVTHPADAQPHEARLLSLDSSKARQMLGWVPRWNLDRALMEIAAWNKGHLKNMDMRAITLAQIKSFILQKET